MRVLKIICFTGIGAICGAGLMYALLPVISRIFVGEIYGEDQMSLNFAIFFIGIVVLGVIGAVIGGAIAKKRKRSIHSE